MIQQQTSSQQTRARQQVRSGVKLGNPNDKLGVAEDRILCRHTTQLRHRVRVVRAVKAH